MSAPYGYLHRILTKDITFFNNVTVTGSTGSGWKNINTLIQKTFLYYNGTDKSGSFQLSGSRTEDGALQWEVGSLITLNASGSTDYTTVTDVFPFMQINVIFSADPTSGSISAWCFGRED